MIRYVADRPPPAGPSACPACGAPVVWAVTEAGKRLPVDVAPRAGGRLELYTEHWPDGEPVEPGVHRVRVRPEGRPPSSPVWWPHWATCAAGFPDQVPADVVAFIEAACERRWGPLGRLVLRGRKLK